jgi:hypothetical protein
MPTAFTPGTTVVSDALIIETFFRNSKGIRGVARALGISKVRAGQVVLAYKKKHHLR